MHVHFAGRDSFGPSMDEAFGRATHVSFLEHVPFLRLFAMRYARYFREPDGEAG